MATLTDRPEAVSAANLTLATGDTRLCGLRETLTEIDSEITSVRERQPAMSAIEGDLPGARQLGMLIARRDLVLEWIRGSL